MKVSLMTTSVILLLVASLPALPSHDTQRQAVTASLVVDNSTFIDANRLMAFVTNHGNFGRDLDGIFGYDYGTWFPFVDTSLINEGGAAALRSPLYAAGLWIAGVDRATGDTLVALSEYASEYGPGIMIGGEAATDIPEFRVYKLYRDSLKDNPNVDYLEYLDVAVPDQGAPFVVDSVGDTIPDMIGDQMLWCVYNDADATRHDASPGGTAPLGLEIKQTVFAYTRDNPTGDVIFIRYRIFNKGDKTLDSMFVSAWSDPDLGSAGDDLVGCDTSLSLGYCYNGDNYDASYGSAPPAVGFDFFQGPLVARTVETADAPPGRMWGQLWPDSVNLGMTSFNKYIGGLDPDSYAETYFFMEGLTKVGNSYINPATGEVTTFVHSGNPLTGEGDIDVAPADRRMMQTTGPITFAPGDSTEIVVGLVAGRGADNLSSITVLKFNDEFAQTAYDAGLQVPNPPAPPQVRTRELQNELILYWDETSELVPGGYPFQGYTVYQGEGPSGPWTRLANFDVIDGVAVILDNVLDSATGALELRVVKAGRDNGLKRFYATQTDALTGGDLVVGIPYYYRVEAYTYNPDATPKTLTSANQAPIVLTPQRPVDGIETTVETSDTLDVTHVVGVANGVVAPLAIDPLAMTDHQYEVTFHEDTTVDNFSDTTISTFWRLRDLTTGEVKVAQSFNFSGDDDYPIVDGFMLKVIGSQPGVVRVEEIANAGNPVDPPKNVVMSPNSTGDWYVSSDQGADLDRMNWRGLIGSYDWEIRWVDTAYAPNAGSEYYDWSTDAFFPGAPRAPFQVWNLGIGTPDDVYDDTRIFFSVIDDDQSGDWSWGDRIYPWEEEYYDPAPAFPPYVFPDDFRIGRIVFNDVSHTMPHPSAWTAIRFTTAKVFTPADVFTFYGSAPIQASAGPESALDDIKAVPNPFYYFSAYDPSPTEKVIKFINLPAKATISIYNLSGDFVARIEKDDPTTSIAQWDVRNRFGRPVALGIYIYHVNAPGFGEKVGKILVFSGDL